MVKLTYLDISFNKLRTVDRSNIGLLPNLKSILCEGNFLKNVNSFSKLQGLNFLSFENNKITEFSSFEKLSFLDNLKDLNLSHNPVAKFSSYRINVMKKFNNLNKLDNLDITKEDREGAFIEIENNTKTIIFEPIQFAGLDFTKTQLKKVKYMINIKFLDSDES